ncbi:hypothetical protein [Streptomyces wuyuanensis]|uniref:hypothetical protein n=1 Tax=Streptomyces wuyuanensis TaxID=1196353 RepID=UPI003719B0C0
MAQLSGCRPGWEYATSLDTSPYAATWAELDPARHPFVWDDDEETRVSILIKARVPPVRSGHEGRWAGERRCVDQVTALFAERYGSWAQYWNWSPGEGDRDGGVVGVWCCGAHSVTTPDETTARVVAALLEWRDWLEELAERSRRPARPAERCRSARETPTRRAAASGTA